MRRLPASSAFSRSQLGKQGLRTEFRYQGIISYRVVEAFEPVNVGSCQLRFVLLSEDFRPAPVSLGRSASAP
jgi:hypothetical protein